MFVMIQISNERELNMIQENNYEMKQVDLEQAIKLFNIQQLVPYDNCWVINQDTGGCEKGCTKDIIRNLSSIRSPIFKTDDDGRLKIVTLDIYYNYRNNDLYTGNVIRILLLRKEKLLRKGEQPTSLSNDVGASTHDIG